MSRLSHTATSYTRPRRFTFTADIYVATLYQLFISLLLLWLTRFAFVWYNADQIDLPSFGRLMSLSFYGLRFDLLPVAYFNSLFILMRILPFGFTTRRGYLRLTDWIWYITNAIMLSLNIGDIAYFRFSGARMRWTMIQNMMSDSGIATIILSYASSYWWAYLGAVIMIIAMIWLYHRVTIRPVTFGRLRDKARIAARVGMFLLMGAMTFLCMRGRAGTGRPISIADAIRYVDSSPQINVVLNTPFTVLRSMDTRVANSEVRHTFYSDSELADIRTSVHMGSGADRPLDKNVVIIIIESGGSNFVDTLNIVPGDSAMHLMPYLDSIASKSLVALHNIATGRVSSGGATAVLGGFPAFDPFYFMLSPYNKDVIDAPANLLGLYGWDSAFFYGCNNGSFYIDQMAKATGFNKLYNREDYGYMRDYDGMWGIFDEPMARYVIDNINTLSTPFIASWFTISAHGPFTLPDGYDTSVFRHPEASPERGLEYTDRALRVFFEEAAKQPWYANTIFVITGDHGNRDFKGTRYDTPWYHHHVPFIVYTPDGSIAPRRVDDRVMAQFDIPATLMSLMNYPDSYVSVGTDLLNDSVPHYGIARFGDRYYVYSTEYGAVISTDASKIEELYHLPDDGEMRSPLPLPYPAEADSMLTWTRAFLQDYTHRMIDDRLHITR